MRREQAKDWWANRRCMMPKPKTTYTQQDQGFGEAHGCVVHLLPCLTLQPPHIKGYYASSSHLDAAPEDHRGPVLEAQPLAIGLMYLLTWM